MHNLRTFSNYKVMGTLKFRQEANGEVYTHVFASVHLPTF